MPIRKYSIAARQWYTRLFKMLPSCALRKASNSGGDAKEPVDLILKRAFQATTAISSPLMARRSFAG